MALGVAGAHGVVSGADAAVLVAGADIERADAPLHAGAIDSAAVYLAAGERRRASDRVGQGRTRAARQLAAEREDGRRPHRHAELRALAGDRVAVALQPPGRLLQQPGPLGVDERQP